MNADAGLRSQAAHLEDSSSSSHPQHCGLTHDRLLCHHGSEGKEVCASGPLSSLLQPHQGEERRGQQPLYCYDCYCCHSCKSTAAPEELIVAAVVQVVNVDNSTAAPSVLLFFDQHRYLFNAGEGIQRHFIEHKQRMNKV